MILVGPSRRHCGPTGTPSARIPAMESYIVFGLVLLVIVIGATLALIAPRFRKPPTLPPAPPETKPQTPSVTKAPALVETGKPTVEKPTVENPKVQKPPVRKPPVEKPVVKAPVAEPP